MRRTTIGLVIVFICLGAQNASGQPPLEARVVREATKVAEEALATFAKLVTNENYRAMGFNSPGEVRGAVLGVPLPEFLVRLDDLTRFSRGEDPAGFVHASGRVTFPVRVADNIRSTLTVARAGASWEAVSFGAPTYGRHLDGVRSRLAQQEGRSAGDYFEVRVPALNVTFVGTRKDGQLLLTPIVDDTRFGFRGGVTLRAEDALTAMVQAARDHNGLPT